MNELYSFSDRKMSNALSVRNASTFPSLFVVKILPGVIVNFLVFCTLFVMLIVYERSSRAFNSVRSAKR